MNRNTDPTKPWNQQPGKTDPVAPWNRPEYRNNPDAPWNYEGGSWNEYDRERYNAQ